MAKFLKLKAGIFRATVEGVSYDKTTVVKVERPTTIQSLKLRAGVLEYTTEAKYEAYLESKQISKESNSSGKEEQAKSAKLKVSVSKPKARSKKNPVEDKDSDKE